MLIMTIVRSTSPSVAHHRVMVSNDPRKVRPDTSNTATLEMSRTATALFGGMDQQVLDLDLKRSATAPGLARRSLVTPDGSGGGQKRSSIITGKAAHPPRQTQTFTASMKGTPMAKGLC